MRTPKHSPGPWQSAETVSGKLVIVYDREPGFQQTVAEIKSKPGHARFDAMLIRASPDMLAALLALNNDDGAIPKATWALVQNAVLKAMGGAE